MHDSVFYEASISCFLTEQQPPKAMQRLCQIKVWIAHCDFYQREFGSFPFLPPPPPPQRIISPQSKLWLLLPVYMYLFTEYVFRESVDRAHNSQISSTFQEADCLLQLVKINKQVFAITLLSRNLNHTAQLSLSARGGNNNFVSRAGGGGEETEKTREF